MNLVEEIQENVKKREEASSLEEKKEKDRDDKIVAKMRAQKRRIEVIEEEDGYLISFTKGSRGALYWNIAGFSFMPILLFLVPAMIIGYLKEIPSLFAGSIYLAIFIFVLLVLIPSYLRNRKVHLRVIKGESGEYFYSLYHKDPKTPIHVGRFNNLRVDTGTYIKPNWVFFEDGEFRYNGPEILVPDEEVFSNFKDKIERLQTL